MALLTSATAWRGSGVSFASIARGIAEHGHRPHLLAGAAEVVHAFAALGLPVTLVPTGDTGLREVRALRRTLDALAADVLVVDRPRDLRLGALASLGRHVAIVNRYNLSRAHPPADLLSRVVYRRVRCTVFPSDALARRALAAAPYLQRVPHRVIHNGIDAEQFRPDPAGAAAFRAAHGLAGTPFVLAIGSLMPEKRYDFLMDSLAGLGADAPALVIGGDGPLVETIRARADAHRLDVRLLGTIDPPRLPSAYSAAECVVHACAVETFGWSVLEAMACGAAVLATRGGALPEVLGDAGVMTSPDDATAFGRDLRALLRDTPRRAQLGAAARERAVTHFPLARMRAAYVETIESAAHR